jgi:hypothetical protein
VDNIVAYELVLPGGEVITVSHDTQPELFFGLKGGLNNFVSSIPSKLLPFPNPHLPGNHDKLYDENASANPDMGTRVLHCSIRLRIVIG